MKPVHVLGLGALGIGGVAVYQAMKRKRDVVPAKVNRAALDALAGVRVSPCGTATARPRDYTELYIEQKRALIAQFGSAVEHNCGLSGFAPCIPLPSKGIPTPTSACLAAVVDDWMAVAHRVADEADGELAADLVKLRFSLAQFRTILGGSGHPSAETNRRVWSTIGRLAIVLQGVAVTHGVGAEARKQLVDDLTDPAAYAGAASDVLGGVLGVVAQVAGGTAAAFLASNLGAIAVVGGVAYFVWRRSS
jgi:hypothetical protein